LKMIDSACGARLYTEGRELVNFGGACYLGLSDIPELQEAARAAAKYGAIAPVPRHYGFSVAPVEEAENAARAFFNTESAIYFPTGYLFGLVALHGLASRIDMVYTDSNAHYCLKDGIAASGKPAVEFDHLDADDLRRKMNMTLKPKQVPAVVTDGMFATFGDIAPLDEYSRILAPYDGFLIVDESHSFGVIGPNGRGAVEKYGLSRERVLAGGSLSKAFCAFGGIAVGSSELIDALSVWPPIRGSSAGMSAAAAMSAAAMQYAKAHPELLTRLRKLVGELKLGLSGLGISVKQTESPVVAFTLESRERMLALQRFLNVNGIYVLFSEYIGAGADGVIRCAVFADHTEDDVRLLLTMIARFLKG